MVPKATCEMSYSLYMCHLGSLLKLLAHMLYSRCAAIHAHGVVPLSICTCILGLAQFAR